MSFFADNDGQLLGMKFKEVTKENEGQEQTYNYQYNNRGDIIGLTNIDGNMAAEYSFEPWGSASINIPEGDETNKNTSEHIASLNPYRYVGKYGVFYDNDSELYLMSIRNYDSDTGRFIESATYEGEEDAPFSQNKYLYAEGDPANNIDPDGQWIVDAIFLASDVREFVRNPSFCNAAWIAVDTVTFIDASGTMSMTAHGLKLGEIAGKSKRLLKYSKGIKKIYIYQ